MKYGLQLRDKANRFLILVLALLLTGLTAVFWFNFQEQYFGGLSINDAMDYAGIARNIMEGEGITSQYSTPLSLVYHSIPQPDMWRAPGWPLFLAGFQNILGASDEASAWAGGFCFILAAPLVFILAVLLFERKIGVIIGLLAWLFYLFSPQFLNYSISGMTESLSILLMLLLMVLLFSGSGFNWQTNLLIGLVLGFFYLTRYNAILFLPLILILRCWQSPKGGKLKAALIVLASFLVVVSPWLIRNIYLFGNPLFSLQKYELLMFTETYPDYTLYGLPESLSVFSLTGEMWNDIGAKFCSNWQEFVSLLPEMDFWGVCPWLLLLFVLPVYKIKPQVTVFKITVLVFFVGQLLALLILHFIPRLFYMFTPLLSIGAIGSLVLLGQELLSGISRFDLRRGFRVGLVVALCLSGGWTAFAGYFDFNFEATQESEILPQIQEIVKMTSADQTLLTNEGQTLSWYGDRYALKLPYSMTMLKQVQDLTEIDGIYITERILWNIPEVEREWTNLYYGRPKVWAGYELAQTFKDKNGKCLGVLYLKEKNAKWNKEADNI